MIRSFALAAAMFCFAGAELSAQTVRYRLEPGSEFLLNSCGPTEQHLPMRGFFKLGPVNPGPLYDSYDVQDVLFVVTRPDHTEFRILGSGKYLLGGEVLVAHDLTLTASVDDVTTFYDSGITPVDPDHPFPDHFFITTRSPEINCQWTALVLDAVPSPCPADMDGSGEVDSRDFFAYVTAFFAGDRGADFNNDGVVDSEDFFAFVQEFLRPC